VLVIDDSVSTRRWIRGVLERAGIAVAGEAGDGRAGRDQILALDPDVITLDLDMPDVDGITLLHAITRSSPRPVVVLSGKVAPGSAAAMSALEAGAAHVLAKPGPRNAAELAAELVRRVQQAARAKVRFQPAAAGPARPPVDDARFTPGQLVAIGSSTGGPSALREVLGGLPAHVSPVVVSQHIPPDQPSSLAERLAAMLGRDVAAARDGEPLAAGMVRIAPPDRHLKVEWSNGRYVTRLSDEAAPQQIRPSVDVMFHAVAQAAGRRAVGVILTGMGQDGAVGLAAMRAAGAATVAQDEATSAVFGMPRAAIERGAAGTVASLDRIATAIVRNLQRLAPTS
jgi:two-component system chemotaxis response regulator CheB